MKIKLPIHLHAWLLPIASVTLCVTAPQAVADATVTDNGSSVPFTAAAGEKITIDISSGYLITAKPTDPTRVAVADIIVKNWNIINGYSPSTYTFNGSLTASADATGDEGNIRFNWSAGTNQVYNFNGNLSGYTGNFDINGNLALNFGGDKTDEASRISISGTGNIESNNDDPIHYMVTSGASTVTNATIDVVDLRFSYSTYDVSSAVTTDALTVNEAATTNFTGVVNSTTTQTIAGTASFNNTATLSGTRTISGTLAIGATGSVSLAGTTTNTGNISIASGGTLNLSGTYTGSGTISNSGTLNFMDGVTLNLENFTADNGVYRIFTQTDGATVSGFTSLTAEDLTGVVLSGYTVVFSDDGTITTTLNAVEHTWSSATDITWEIGTVFEAGKTYANNDILNIESNATISLGADISAAQINVASGYNATIDAAEHSLTAGTISIAGGLTLRGDLLAIDTSVVSVGDSSQLNLDLGAGVEKNYSDQLQNYAGDITVQSGTLTYASAADLALVNTATGISVASGATLSVAGANVGFAGIELTDGATLSVNGVTGFSSIIQTAGDITLHAHTAESTLDRGITGNGTITKTGSSVIEILASQTHTGILDITAGGVKLGDDDRVALAVAYSDIIVREGTTFTFQNGQTNFNHIQLDGGTYANNDASSNANTIAKLSVTKNSNLTTNWNAEYNIAELTGTANLNVSESTVRTTDPFELNVATMKNFDGTLDMGNKDRLNLSITAVEQEAGNHAIISGLHGGLTGENFSMSGGGTLELQTGMTMTGTVTQTGGGVIDLKQDATVGTYSMTGGTTNVGANLTVTSSVNLDASSTIGTAGYLLQGKTTDATITKKNADANIVMAQNAVSNAVLTNAMLTVKVGEVLILNDVDLVNSTLDLEAGTLNATDVSIANSQIKAGATDKGTQTLTVAGGEESLQVYSMTGLTSEVTISEDVALDITLSDAMYNSLDAFETDTLFAFELENVLASSFTSTIDEVSLNLYNEAGLLFAGTSLKIQEVTTSEAGFVTFVVTIPEPSTAALSLLALAGLLGRRRRKA